MTRVIEYVLPSLVVTIIGFVGGVFLNWLVYDRNMATVGPSVKLNSNIYMPVDIYNYATTPISRLVLAVPDYVAPEGIILSTPVAIDYLAGIKSNSEESRLVISQIEPQKVTRLFVPLRDVNDAMIIRVHGYDNEDVYLQNPGRLDSPATHLFRSAAVNAIVYAVLFGIFLFISYSISARAERKIDEARSESEKALERLQRIEKQSSSVQGEIEKLKISNSRQKILLLKRITDYQKELSFWRDAIRRILYTYGKDKQDVESLLRSVTERLCTYGTNVKENHDIDTTTILVKYLKDADTSNQ